MPEPVDRSLAPALSCSSVVRAGTGPDIFAPHVVHVRTILGWSPLHDDQMAAGLVGLLLIAVEILVPLVGALAAARAIRRRGRNARLAMAGCLVMLPGPIVSTLGMTLGLEPLMRVVGTHMAAHVLTAMTLPFHLLGFGLILAGALSGPTQPSAPSLRQSPPAPAVEARPY